MRKLCCDKEDTTKGTWSKQEDQKLIDYIKAHGEGRWRSLPKAAGLHRCSNSCRLRWINYLRLDLKRGNFSLDEEDLIIRLHALLGDRWSLIAGRLPGRTDDEVKNYWNSHIKKKLSNLGIDPNNHRLNQHNFTSPPTIASSESVTDPCEDHKPRKSHPLSESASDIEEEEEEEEEATATSLPLNLDLSIAIPASSSLMDAIDKKLQNATETKSIYSREVDNELYPTLVLFR